MGLNSPPTVPAPPAPASRGERVRSFLGWAFALSIAIHLLFGPFLGNYKPNRNDEKETEKVSLSKKVKVVVPTPPPPTPTPPPPTPPPKSTPPPVKQTNPPPQPKLKVEPPKTKSNNASSSSEHAYDTHQKGSENGVPQGTVASAAPAPAATGVPATPAPTPPPSPTPTRASCAVPNKDAATVQTADLEYPDIAKQQGAVGVAQVKVALDGAGHVTDAQIYKSAGNAALDASAIRAAKASTYSPELTNCQPVPGSYLFRAEFSGQ